MKAISWTWAGALLLVAQAVVTGAKTGDWTAVPAAVAQAVGLLGVRRAALRGPK